MSQEAQRRHSENPNALPEGTRLGEFELRQLLGVGGFGIVYLAFDHALEREVAIKEYMPASLAGRTETMHVSIRSQSDAETFELGRRSFVNEARLLAQFDHPSLLKVHRFWEANGTAYMAMPVMRGRTVRDVRLGMSQPPDETWMRSILEPLLGAIDTLHAKGVYHRDIAPDNIQIEPDGHPVLLDFGAARRVLSDKSQALTAILKPAYAPIEQYAEAGSVKQGPWTDIYALGATLHFLLLGRPPPPATARTVHDEASALTALALPGCSEKFLQIIDWMLAPRPADRPQSVAALREALAGHTMPPVRHVPPQSAPADWDRTVMMPSVAAQSTALQPPSRADEATWPPRGETDATLVLPQLVPPHVPPSVPPSVPPRVAPQPPRAAAQVPVGASDITMRMPPPGQPQRVSAAPALPTPAARSKLLPMGLGLGAVLIGMVVAFGMLRKEPVAPVVPDIAAASVPAPNVSATPLPPATSSTPESQVAQVVVPAAAALPTATGAANAASIPSDPVRAPAPENAAPSTSPAPAATPAASKAPTSTFFVKPAPTSRVPVPAPAPVVVAAVPTPQPDAPKPREVTPAPAPAPAAAPAAAVETPKSVSMGPEATCGGRNPLSYFVCMEKECLRFDRMDHADCKKWRANARRNND